MHTYTEENYLKAIYKLSEHSEEEVTTNAIAELLETKSSSVSDMLRKLAEKGLIHYTKYRGVTLTEEGRQIAVRIIRKHRLWEVFLVEKLGLGWEEVHPMAEELEHINFERLINKLDAFLGYPKYDPHGDPIPSASGEIETSRSSKLSEMDIASPLLVTGISNHTTAFLQHLDKMGLSLGTKLVIHEITPFDRSMLVTVNKERQLHLSNEVARNILVVVAEDRN
jgi:DtxR family Mn-dependent transcriptional regulator